MKILKKTRYMLFWCAILSIFHYPAASVAKSTSFHSTALKPGKVEMGINQRFRYEYLDEFNIKKYGTGHDDNVLLSRTQPYLRYTISRGPSVFLQGQDSRFWFSDDIDKEDYIQGCPYYNEFDLHQAYLEWRTIAETPFGFKAGRQSVGYGDTRIFGPGGWGNVGRHLWDAGIVYYETKNIKFDFIYGKKIFYDWDRFDEDHYDYHAYGMYVQTKPLTDHTLDFFYAVKDSDSGISEDDEFTVQTAGFYGKGKWHQFDYNATAAYQFGDDGKDDIAAYMMHAEVGFTTALRFKPRLAAGYTIGSGDEDPNDDDQGTYDGVFGGVAKYYGRMNLFSGSNLTNWQTSIAVKLYKGFSICVDYHWFRLAEKKDAWYYCNNKVMRKDETGDSGSDLGEELDMVCKYKINSHLKLMAGYACFFPGYFVENTGTAEDAHWAFTQVIFSF